MFKVNNKDTRTSRWNFILIKLEAPTLTTRQRSGVFIFNFENILQLFELFLLLTLNR